MNRIHQSRRTAFTLIELVASAVLTAMMMAALMSIVWSAVRESNQLRRSELSQFPSTQLIQQLRADFQNARGMAADPTGITLHGFLGPHLVPGRVRYEVQRTADQSILLRGTTADGGVVTEPVWVGLVAIQVEPLAWREPGDEELPEPETGGLPELPTSLRVTMIGQQGRILWREVIHHHAL